MSPKQVEQATELLRKALDTTFKGDVIRFGLSVGWKLSPEGQRMAEELGILPPTPRRTSFDGL